MTVRAAEGEELRPAKSGEVLFTPAQTLGARRGAALEVRAAPGSGLYELCAAGRAAHDRRWSRAAETRGAAQQRLPLVRTSVGQSRSLRNNAVYDRHWDWLFAGSRRDAFGQARARPSR